MVSLKMDFTSSKKKYLTVQSLKRSFPDDNKLASWLQYNFCNRICALSLQKSVVILLPGVAHTKKTSYILYVSLRISTDCSNQEVIIFIVLSTVFISFICSFKHFLILVHLRSPFFFFFRILKVHT